MHCSTRMNESRHTFKCVAEYIWISPATHELGKTIRAAAYFAVIYTHAKPNSSMSLKISFQHVLSFSNIFLICFWCHPRNRQNDQGDVMLCCDSHMHQAIFIKVLEVSFWRIFFKYLLDVIHEPGKKIAVKIYIETKVSLSHSLSFNLIWYCPRTRQEDQGSGIFRCELHTRQAIFHRLY